jgi:hypothetical protein
MVEAPTYRRRTVGRWHVDEEEVAGSGIVQRLNLQEVTIHDVAVKAGMHTERSVQHLSGFDLRSIVSAVSLEGSINVVDAELCDGEGSVGSHFEKCQRTQNEKRVCPLVFHGRVAPLFHVVN